MSPPDNPPAPGPARAGRRPSIDDAIAASFTVAARDGVELAVYRFREAAADGPVLLWGHANGFCAGSYVPFLRLLAPSCRLYAFDARGHGGSGCPPRVDDVSWDIGGAPAPAPGHFAIDGLADDVGRVAAALRREHPDARHLLAAHSFGGNAALHCATTAAAVPWEAMTVFDPVLPPSAGDGAREGIAAGSAELVTMTMRRRAIWDSPETYVESMSRRELFRLWRPGFLEAHCRASLTALPEGSHMLSCPLWAEASIYRAVLEADTIGRLGRVTIPVMLAGSDPVVAPGWVAARQRENATTIPRGAYVCMTGGTHLVPFEQPDRCSNLVIDMLIA